MAAPQGQHRAWHTQGPQELVLNEAKSPGCPGTVLTCREGDGAELHAVQVAPDSPLLHHGVTHGLVIPDVSWGGNKRAM